MVDLGLVRQEPGRGVKRRRRMLLRLGLVVATSIANCRGSLGRRCRIRLHRLTITLIPWELERIFNGRVEALKAHCRLYGCPILRKPTES